MALELGHAIVITNCDADAKGASLRASDETRHRVVLINCDADNPIKPPQQTSAMREIRPAFRAVRTTSDHAVRSLVIYGVRKKSTGAHDDNPTLPCDERDERAVEKLCNSGQSSDHLHCEGADAMGTRSVIKHTGRSALPAGKRDVYAISGTLQSEVADVEGLKAKWTMSTHRWYQTYLQRGQGTDCASVRKSSSVDSASPDGRRDKCVTGNVQQPLVSDVSAEGTGNGLCVGSKEKVEWFEQSGDAAISDSHLSLEDSGKAGSRSGSDNDHVRDQGTEWQHHQRRRRPRGGVRRRVRRDAYLSNASNSSGNRLEAEERDAEPRLSRTAVARGKGIGGLADAGPACSSDDIQKFRLAKNLREASDSCGSGDPCGSSIASMEEIKKVEHEETSAHDRGKGQGGPAIAEPAN